MLKDKFQFKKFVLWGRSMGATASLLYTCKSKKSTIANTSSTNSNSNSNMNTPNINHSQP